MAVMPLLLLAALAKGAVDVPFGVVADVLLGRVGRESPEWFIVMQTRLPMALAAVSAGALLSVSGLIMQTLFANPLAGPSILGVTSGASLGVAVAAMALPGLGLGAPVGAIVGGGFVVLLLVVLSSCVRDGLALLIAGIMLSYLASSGISLLNYFAAATDVKSYSVWGMGSFMGVNLRGALELLGCAVVLIGICCFMVRPLDGFLLGERYAANMGYNVERQRTVLLTLAGLMAAVTTAFCGPIAFIGLTVPHLARMIFSTSAHGRVLPACVVIGSEISLLCALLTVVPSAGGLLPVNAVTPLIGVPVIFYILVARRRLTYMQ